MLITTKLFSDSVAVVERRPYFRMCTASLIHVLPLSDSLSRNVDSDQLITWLSCNVCMNVLPTLIICLMNLSLFASYCVQRVVTISFDVRTRVAVGQPRGSATVSATAQMAQTSWIVVSIISTP